MKCVLVLGVVAFSFVLTTTSAMPPPPQCNPGVLEEIPPRVRKVCAALSTIYELSTAMENYLDDKGAMSYRMMPESSQLMENGAKRQDVDHVFLRFGRRR